MRNILQMLTNSNLGKYDKKEYNEVIGALQEYYTNHARHRYSEITKYILELCKHTDDGEIVEVMLDNLGYIIETIEEQCTCGNELEVNSCRKLDPPRFGCSTSKMGDCYFEEKKLYRSLNKLHDHIYLEFLRIMDIRQHNDTSMIELKDLSKKFQESEKRLADISTQAKRAEKDLRRTNRKVRDAQKEYITILGIFASIVLAFTGGIAFSTSVLENIDAVSPYRLAAVVIGLAFTLINVVYILVWFIQEINKTDEQKVKYPNFMVGINGILIAALVITIGSYVLVNHKQDVAKRTDNIKASISIEKNTSVSNSEYED